MNKHQSTRQPIEDTTPSRIYEEFEIPLAPDNPDEAFDWQITRAEASTQNFGTLHIIGMKLLTPLEEKGQVARARGDSLRMAYELTQGSLSYVVDSAGDRHNVVNHDGSTDMLWAQMHPKIRTLCMQGYSDIATPAPKASTSFLKSRKTRA